jgi:hypothetical protein
MTDCDYFSTREIRPRTPNLYRRLEGNPIRKPLPPRKFTWELINADANHLISERTLYTVVNSLPYSLLAKCIGDEETLVLLSACS